LETILKQSKVRGIVKLHPYSISAEIEMLKWMRVHFSQHLVSFPTSIEEDLLLLEEENDYPKRCVIKIRYLTKKVIVLLIC
jgi:hypothetical protein